MHSFIEEADRQGRAAAHPAFRRVLKEINKHSNAEYFILKSIIVGSLYGVDIMEEATEICKLRLFLKLVAHVWRNDRRENMGLEPLPDVDFNIRAGNTLVGFASLGEVKSALAARLDFSAGETLRQIEEDAREADRAYKRFRQIQTVYDYKDETQAEFKRELRRRLDALAEKLDRHLAEIYGKDPHKQKEFEAWRRSHQPFHWYTEFYGIVTSGGFDVIIGNPPYVELNALSQYNLLGYKCIDSGNLYALIIERCLSLSKRVGREGFIVPVSSISTDRYESLQQLITKHQLHYSSFDDRPSRLFDGLEHIRLTIHLISAHSSIASLFSTRYNKWAAIERTKLFEELSYTVSSTALVAGTLPKLSSGIEESIIEKLSSQKKCLASFYSKDGNRVFYSRKVGYFIQALDFEPKVLDGDGNRRPPSEFKDLRFSTPIYAQTALCCLNANLFY